MLTSLSGLFWMIKSFIDLKKKKKKVNHEQGEKKKKKKINIAQDALQ